MFTLGLAGGLDPIYEQKLDAPENYTYDGAAVLLEDGVVVAAIEEERLDRIKHSNKLPVQAIQFCLQSRDLRLSDLHSIAYYVDEASADGLLTRQYLARPEFSRRLNARELMHQTLSAALACDFEPSKLRFYEHRLTHAASALHQSGFSESLVFVIDNTGGLYAGRRQPGAAASLEILATTSRDQSVQKLCHAVLPLLGLGLFEEYKALALASLGDADAFRGPVSALYQLLPNGDYRLHLDKVPQLITEIVPPRCGAPLSQHHFDLAASLQAAIEEIVLHVAAYHQEKTGFRHLCVAGGMAENVETNSRFVYSGLFDEVFVHPAAYDSGCALGAALLASQDHGCPTPQVRVRSVGWGSRLKGSVEAEQELRRWGQFLQIRRSADIVRDAADALGAGALVAWVQGQSDFGSRALGNRNVFAHPSGTEVRERLHRALGRQETYRSLALFVREEEVHDWCDLPAGYSALPFQTFTVRLREEKHEQASAALCAHGRARVQTVSRELQPRLWSLLGEVGGIAGAPALLSTSFNRSTEPTVESIEHAATCFINSVLDYLIVGDVIVKKVERLREAWMSMWVSIPPFAQVVRTKGHRERQRHATRDEMRATYSPGVSRGVTRALGDLLTELDDAIPLRDLLERAAIEPERKAELVDEILLLASVGMISLLPPPVAAGGSL